jgi:hypothetical protein
MLRDERAHVEGAVRRLRLRRWGFEPVGLRASRVRLRRVIPGTLIDGRFEIRDKLGQGSRTPTP